MSNDVIMRVLWVLWPVAAAYFSLCIGIPEIRPYWHNGARFGPFSSLGLALSFGGSWLVHALITTGVLRESFYSFVFPVVCLGLVIGILGYWIEAADESEAEKRRERQFRKRDLF